METKPKLGSIGWVIGVGFLVLFISSSLRHILFSSGGDLAFFDQGIYLISQGQPPISSLYGFHILADHAAWILYGLALLYKIYPSVYWLFLVQSAALALGTVCTYYLAFQAGLKQSQAVALVCVYILYPVIYNANLFDFHPDAIAVPAILTAVLAARWGKISWFCLSIITVLGCKAVLSLTVAAMGVWLLFFEKRRLFGVISLLSGIAWFAIANWIIIPFFGGEAASINRHLYRYSYLGHSFSETLHILLTQPSIIFTQLFSFTNLEYLALLLLPIIWAITPLSLIPLIGAIPSLALNLLSDHPSQKNLIFHYSLPAIPFLILVSINSLATGKAWLHQKRAIVFCSLVGFLALAKFGLLFSEHMKSLDNWQATQEAISLVKSENGVLSHDNILPHLSQRQLIKSLQPNLSLDNLKEFNYILLNLRHNSNTEKLTQSFLNQVEKLPQTHLYYQRDDVYLFRNF